MTFTEISSKHTIDSIWKKMGKIKSYLSRSFVMNTGDSREGAPSITANLYTSVYGNTVIFDVFYADNSHFLISSGDIFGSHDLAVLNPPKQSARRDSIALVNTDNGVKVFTVDSIIEAINNDFDEPFSETIHGFQLANEFINRIAYNRESENTPYRGNIYSHAILENESGYSYLTYDGFLSEGEFVPFRHIGSKNEQSHKETYVIYDVNDFPSHTADSIDDYELGNSDKPYLHGSFALRYLRAKEHSVTIETLKGSLINLRCKLHKTGNTEGILIENEDVDNNKAFVFIHGGPEYYIENVFDLILSESSLCHALDECQFIYIPLIEHSTDYHEPEKFVTSTTGTKILGDNVSACTDITDFITENEWDSVSVQANSLGGNIALGMIAFCSPDELANIDTIILACPLLSYNDPIESDSFNELQIEGFKFAINEEFDPFDFIGCEEWSQFCSSVSMPHVVVVSTENDPICSIDTVEELHEKLSIGGVPNTYFVDVFGNGHILSDGAQIFIESQI